jgi:virulence-associated protein VagC
MTRTQLGHHAALLDASGISAEVAEARGYRTVTEQSKLRKLGFAEFQARVPALLIPIYNVIGEVVLYQCRPDAPRIKDGKALKYETPLKARMALDVPPGARAKLADPAVPLFITEGVRKADAAVSKGLCAVALLGVWNWRGTNEDGGRVALADWESVALKGRQTYIVFDSDVMLKPEVSGALARLKSFLEARGASVAVIYLPTSEGAAKVGLDDYLAAGHGVDDLVALATSTLRGMPQQEREETKATRGRAIELDDPEPCDEPVDGAEVLDEVVSLLNRFIVLPDGAAAAVALWVAHTYLMDEFNVTPLLALSSPVKRCGKTSLLRILSGLVRRPLPASGISAAAIFRTVEEHQPTLIIDEMDSMKGNEDLRGVLNSGHTRDLAFVIRVVGEGGNMEARRFSTWSAKALAHIGRLPGTLEDRAVRIPMRRKLPGEHRARIRRRELDAALRPIRRRLARWAQDVRNDIARREPPLPEILDDRASDNWEPLVAIADAAGGGWPERARDVAVSLSVERGGDEAEENAGLLLLNDLRDLIDAGELDTQSGVSGEKACAQLRGLDDRPWRTWGKGKDGLLPVHMSSLLRPFGIKTDRRVRTARRYPLEAVREAIGRYLSPARDGATTTVTPVTPMKASRGSSAGSTREDPVTGVTGLARRDGSAPAAATLGTARGDADPHARGPNRVGDRMPDGRIVLEVDAFGPVVFSKVGANLVADAVPDGEEF